MNGISISEADPSGLTGPPPAEAGQPDPAGRCRGRRSEDGTAPEQPLAHSS
jgi:hypothetical protein